MGFPLKELEDAFSDLFRPVGHILQVNSPGVLPYTRSGTAGWPSGHPTSVLLTKDAVYPR